MARVMNGLMRSTNRRQGPLVSPHDRTNCQGQMIDGEGKSETVVLRAGIAMPGSRVYVCCVHYLKYICFQKQRNKLEI